MSRKTELLEHIRSVLAGRLERLTLAAREAHAAATDPGSKAESKYDTRSLEASYLASGQARAVEETAAAVERFNNLTLPELEPDEPIRAGALVEADMDGESSWFLMAPAAGGEIIEHDGLSVTLLTPASSLYRQLLGKRVGDSLDDSDGFVTEVL